MNNFKKHIENIAELSEEEWQAFYSILKVQRYKKKELFLEVGQICNYSAFISFGIFRFFTLDKNGNEKIIQFNLEATFLSDCESYLNKKPSNYTIQALENSEIITFKNSDLEQLCLDYPVFDKIGRKITTEILSYYKEHIQLLMVNTPQERYEYILSKKPELIQRVSVTQLSQFLGLTRETVSRLRGKIRTI